MGHLHGEHQSSTSFQIEGASVQLLRVLIVQMNKLVQEMCTFMSLATA